VCIINSMVVSMCIRFRLGRRLYVAFANSIISSGVREIHFVSKSV
jgi:hypothetical protein